MTAPAFHRLFSGPACLFEGYRLLVRPRLRRFLILPLCGNLAVFLLALLLCWISLDWAVAAWLPAGWSWLGWLLLPILAGLLLWAFLLGFTVLANLLLGPFLDRLATAARAELGLPALPQVALPGWRASLMMELRRWRYLGLCLLGVFVLGWIPLLQVAAPPLALLVSAWFLAIESSSHAFVLRGRGFDAQLAVLRRHRGSALAFGLAASAALLLPLLNLLLMPAAVIGMTLWVEQHQPAEQVATARAEQPEPATPPAGR